MEDGNGFVAGEIFCFLAQLFVGVQILGGQGVIGPFCGRAQVNAAEGVKADGASDVGMVGNEAQGSGRFWFTAGVLASAGLVRLPKDGELPVEVQPLQRWGKFDGDAIIILNLAFGNEPVKIAAGRFIWFAGNHQARIIGVNFPAAVGVFETHLQDTAVAVHIFFVQPVQRVRAGVGAGAAANVFGLVGQSPLCAVGIEAGHNVESTRV